MGLTARYDVSQSEKFVGAWMKERNNRDQIVLATKYTIGYRNNDPDVKVKVGVRSMANGWFAHVAGLH